MCCCNWSVIIIFPPFFQKTAPVTENITAMILDGGRSSSRQRMTLFIDTNPSIANEKVENIPVLFEVALKENHPLTLASCSRLAHPFIPLNSAFTFTWQQTPMVKSAQFSAMQALKKLQLMLCQLHKHERTPLEFTDDVIRGFLTVESRYPLPLRSFNSNVNKNKSRIKRMTAAPVEGVGGVLDGIINYYS